MMLLGENPTRKARNSIGLPKLTITAESFVCQSRVIQTILSRSERDVPKRTGGGLYRLAFANVFCNYYRDYSSSPDY